MALSPQENQDFQCFRSQYLQLQTELIYPTSDCLRNETFQDVLYKEMFKDGSLQYPPPPRYKLRVLKELARRIEASILDWEEEVRKPRQTKLQFLSDMLPPFRAFQTTLWPRSPLS